MWPLYGRMSQMLWQANALRLLSSSEKHNWDTPCACGRHSCGCQKNANNPRLYTQFQTRSYTSDIVIQTNAIYDWKGKEISLEGWSRAFVTVVELKSARDGKKSKLDRGTLVSLDVEKWPLMEWKLCCAPQLKGKGQRSKLNHLQKV